MSKLTIPDHVRYLFEKQFLSYRNFRTLKVRRDIVAAVQYNGTVYLKLKRDRWTACARIDFYHLDGDEGIYRHTVVTSTGKRYCGSVLSAAHALAALGLLGEEEGAQLIVALRAQAAERERDHDVRSLENDAARLGYRVVAKKAA